MGMKYIRDTYGVPAKRGVRVRMTPPGGAALCQYGTITGACGKYLKIRMDGEIHSHTYHPTWALEYMGHNAIELTGSPLAASPATGGSDVE